MPLLLLSWKITVVTIHAQYHQLEMVLMENVILHNSLYYDTLCDLPFSVFPLLERSLAIHVPDERH